MNSNEIKEKAQGFLKQANAELQELIGEGGSEWKQCIDLPIRLNRIQELTASIDKLVLIKSPGSKKYESWIAADMARFLESLGKVIQEIKSSAGKDIEKKSPQPATPLLVDTPREQYLKTEDMKPIDVPESLNHDFAQSLSARRHKVVSPGHKQDIRSGALSARIRSKPNSGYANKKALSNTTPKKKGKPKVKAGYVPPTTVTQEIQVFCGRVLPVQRVYKGKMKKSSNKSRGPSTRHRVSSRATGSKASSKRYSHPTKLKEKASSSREKGSSTLDQGVYGIRDYLESQEGRMVILEKIKDCRQYEAAGDIPQDVCFDYAASVWRKARASSQQLKYRYGRTPSLSILRDSFSMFEHSSNFGHMQSIDLQAFLHHALVQVAMGDYEDSDVDDCHIQPLSRKMNVANLKNRDDVLSSPGSFCISPICKREFRNDPRYNMPEELDDDKYYDTDEEKNNLKGDGDEVLPSPGGLIRSLAIDGKWKESAVKPSNGGSNDPRLPDESLELEWVYGYRSRDGHSNVFSDEEGSLVYPVSCVGVVHNVLAKTQRHYRGHAGTITCIARHPINRSLFATGSAASVEKREAQLPCIHVWSSMSPDFIAIIPDAHKRCVRSMGFSRDGNVLASVGFDENNSINSKIWDWKKKELIAQLSIGLELIFDLCWSSTDPTLFTTVGRNEICNWKNSGAGKLSCKVLKLNEDVALAGGIVLPHKRKPIPTADKKARKQHQSRRSYLCVTYTRSGDMVVGVQGYGDLLVFRDNEHIKCKKAVHNGSVYTLTTCKDLLLSGGKDGKINIFDSKYNLIKRLHFHSSIRAICANSEQAPLIVGTVRSRIWTLSDWLNTADASHAKIHISGHFDGELHGLDIHPKSSHIFATSGEDNRITLWDAEKRQMIASWPMTVRRGKRVKRRGPGAISSQPSWRASRAIAFSPDGRLIAVGTNYTEIRIFDSSKHKEVRYVDLGKLPPPHNPTSSRALRPSDEIGNGKRFTSPITCIKYSPDGTILAAGLNCSLVLLDVRSGNIPKAHLPVEGGVVNFDFTANSEHLRVVSGKCELLFFDIFASDLKLSRPADDPYTIAKRKPFLATQSCMFDWGLIGLRDLSADGTEYTSVCINQDHGLLAAGDCFGNLTLARYPMLNPDNQRYVQKTHAETCAKVKIAPNLSRLYTVGGRDKCVMQYRILNPHKRAIIPDTSPPTSPSRPVGTKREQAAVVARRDEESWADKGERVRLKGRINQMKKMIEQMKRRYVPNRKLISENRSLRKQIAILDKELRVQANKSEKQARDAKERHANVQKGLRNKITRLIDDPPTQAMVSENKRLKEQVEDLRQDNRRILEDLNNVKEAADISDIDKLRECKIRLKQAQRKIKDLEGRLEVVADKLDCERSRASQAEKNADKLRQKAERESRHTDSKTRILQKESSDKSEKLKKSESKIRKLEKQVLALKKGKDEAHQKAQKDSQSLTEQLQKHRQEMDVKVKQLETSQQDLQSKVDMKVKELETRNKEFAALQAQEVEAKNQVKQLQGQVKDEKDRVKAISKQLEENVLQQEVTDLKSKITKLSEEKKNIEEELRTAKSLYLGKADDQDLIQEMEKKLQDSQTNLRKMKEAIEQGKKESQKLLEENKKLIDARDDMLIDYTEAQEELVSLREASMKANNSNDELAKLKKEVEILKKENVSLRSTLMEDDDLDLDMADELTALRENNRKLKEEAESFRLITRMPSKYELNETKSELDDLEESRDRQDSGEINLPDPVKDLKINLPSSLGNKRDSPLFNTKVKCGNCEDKYAVTFCSECPKNRELCQECDEEIHRVKKKSGHKRVPLTKSRSSLAATDGSNFQLPAVFKRRLSIKPDQFPTPSGAHSNVAKSPQLGVTSPASLASPSVVSPLNPTSVSRKETEQKERRSEEKTPAKREEIAVKPASAASNIKAPQASVSIKDVLENTGRKPLAEIKETVDVKQMPAISKQDPQKPPPNNVPPPSASVKICQECECDDAVYDCFECKMAFCPDCNEDVHENEAKASHRRFLRKREEKHKSMSSSSSSSSSSLPPLSNKASSSTTSLKKISSKAPIVPPAIPSTINQKICQECECDDAIYDCIGCNMALCADCESDKHSDAAKAAHKRILRKPGHLSKTPEVSSSTPTTTNVKMCQECECDDAVFDCIECNMALCADCDSDKHSDANDSNKATHKRIERK